MSASQAPLARATEGREPIPTWLPKRKAFMFDTPEDFPIKLHTLTLLSGTKGSGKNVALTSALSAIKKLSLADRVFWVSKTAGANSEHVEQLGIQKEDVYEPTNGSLAAIEAAVQKEGDEWNQYVEDSKLYKELQRALRKNGIDNLDPKLQDRAERAGFLDGREEPTSKYGHKPCCHLLLDDAMGEEIMSSGPRSKLVNLCIKHRNIADGLGVSMWICVQSWSAMGSLPRSVRENAGGACIWFTPHEKQIDTMANELADRSGVDAFKAAYKLGTQGEHDFLYINKTAKNTPRFYNRGWNQPLGDEISAHLASINGASAGASEPADPGEVASAIPSRLPKL